MPTEGTTKPANDNLSLEEQVTGKKPLRDEYSEIVAEEVHSQLDETNQSILGGLPFFSPFRPADLIEKLAELREEKK